MLGAWSSRSSRYSKESAVYKRRPDGFDLDFRIRLQLRPETEKQGAEWYGCRCLPLVFGCRTFASAWHRRATFRFLQGTKSSSSMRDLFRFASQDSIVNSQFWTDQPPQFPALVLLRLPTSTLASMLPPPHQCSFKHAWVHRTGMEHKRLWPRWRPMRSEKRGR